VELEAQLRWVHNQGASVKADAWQKGRLGQRGGTNRQANRLQEGDDGRGDRIGERAIRHDPLQSSQTYRLKLEAISKSSTPSNHKSRCAKGTILFQSYWNGSRGLSRRQAVRDLIVVIDCQSAIGAPSTIIVLSARSNT